MPSRPQDDLEPLALAPAPAPRPPQDLMGLRLAQEKALKRQLEEEQKLKPGGVGAPSSSSSASASARSGPPQPDEAVDFREEGPEGETPAIFISVDDDSGLPEATLLDSSLEGPLPKVGLATRSSGGRTPGPGAACLGAQVRRRGGHTHTAGIDRPPLLSPGGSSGRGLEGGEEPPDPHPSRRRPPENPQPPLHSRGGSRGPRDQGQQLTDLVGKGGEGRGRGGVLCLSKKNKKKKIVGLGRGCSLSSRHLSHGSPRPRLEAPWAAPARKPPPAPSLPW